jgi:hypothetical protein
LRARDEHDNLSGQATGSYAVPAPVAFPFNVQDIQWGNVFGPDRVDIILEYAYPVGEDSGEESFTAIVFFLNQSPPTSYNFNHASVHSYDFSGAGNDALAILYPNCRGYGGPLAGLVVRNHSEGRCDPPFATNNQILQSYTHGASPSPDANNILLSVDGRVRGKMATTINDVGVDSSYVFSADDYITLGFYAFDGSKSFRHVAVHSVPIYFTE